MFSKKSFFIQWIIINFVAGSFNFFDRIDEFFHCFLFEENDLDLDDSGPYEEIDEDIEENEPEMINRPPVRRLPSFIPLTLGQIDNLQADEGIVQVPEEEDTYEERLI